MHKQSVTDNVSSGTDQSVNGLAILLLSLGYKLCVILVTMTWKIWMWAELFLSMLIYTLLLFKMMDINIQKFQENQNSVCLHTIHFV